MTALYMGRVRFPSMTYDTHMRTEVDTKPSP
jgi:hypothetical protein